MNVSVEKLRDWARGAPPFSFCFVPQPGQTDVSNQAASAADSTCLVEKPLVGPQMLTEGSDTG